MRTTRKYEMNGVTEFSVSALNQLLALGFKYVQVKGLTVDKHAEYVEPNLIVLLPCKRLPKAMEKKDIYEPIKSEVLYRWAGESNENPTIVIAKY